MRSILAFILLAVPRSVEAGDHASENEHATHPPTVSLVNGVTYTLDGHGLESAMTVHGVRGAFMLGSRFKLSAEAGGAVILADLLPAGYVQIGPGVIVSDGFQVSLYGTWKAHGHEEIEGYDLDFGEGAGASTQRRMRFQHLLGAAVAPTFVTNFGNVNVPIGFQCPVGGHEGCAGVVSFKLVTDIFAK